VSPEPAADDVLVTAKGYERRCSELESLRTEGPPAMSERLREARAVGHFEDRPALFDVRQDRRARSAGALLGLGPLISPLALWRLSGRLRFGRSKRAKTKEWSTSQSPRFVRGWRPRTVAGRSCTNHRTSK
jgi:hypothetical protein